MKLSRWVNPDNVEKLSRQDKTVKIAMQKPLKILIDKSAVWLNNNPFGGLCLGLGCQDVTISVLYLRLKHNGTAIGVVCVTGAANRPNVPFVGMELSRWQAGMAQYLQSRVRLFVRSRYDDERFWMVKTLMQNVKCPEKVLQIL